MSVAPTANPTSATRRVDLVIAAALLAALVWSYWPTLADLAAFWRVNEDYSVGQLVPLVGVFLVWRERRRLARETARPLWWALGLVLVFQLARLYGVERASASIERLSLWLTGSSLLLLVFGWRIWKRLFWVQAFMLLMLPLPHTLHRWIALPLQDWATSLGQFGLEIAGFFVTRDGNVLTINGDIQVGVDEACSGLRMLTAFVFTAALLVFIVRRPAWQRTVVMLSAGPIAVLANGVRVLATAAFFYYVSDAEWRQGFHDVAGYLMMPLGIVCVLIVLKVLSVVSQAPPKQAAEKA